jgi:hypothetical protein
MSATMPRPSSTPAATAASTPQSLGPLPPLEGFDPRAGSQPALGSNNKGGVWVPQMARPRRNRKSETVRGMVRENIVLPRNFIYPLFIHDEVRACVRWMVDCGVEFGVGGGLVGDDRRLTDLTDCPTDNRMQPAFSVT